MDKELVRRCISDLRNKLKTVKPDNPNQNIQVNYYSSFSFFDYIAPGTFSERQRKGFWRYQLFYEGTSDEIRFYDNGGGSVDAVTFAMLNSREGMEALLEGDNEKLMLELFESFKNCGTTESVKKRALDNANDLP